MGSCCSLLSHGVLITEDDIDFEKAKNVLSKKKEK